MVRWMSAISTKGPQERRVAPGKPGVGSQRGLVPRVWWASGGAVEAGAGEDAKLIFQTLGDEDGIEIGNADGENTDAVLCALRAKIAEAFDVLNRIGKTQAEFAVVLVKRGDGLV